LIFPLIPAILVGIFCDKTMSDSTTKDDLITKILGQVQKIKDLHEDITDLQDKITDINSRIETAEDWTELQDINFAISQL
jgi:peptidoglycan hydrolase CwlO-like protein